MQKELISIISEIAQIPSFSSYEERIHPYIFDFIEDNKIDCEVYVLHNSLVIDINKNQAQATVYAYLQKDHFELVVAQNSKLILFNSFAYQTIEDVMYYVLFTYEQLGLSPETHSLVLLGAIEEGDPIHQTALRFIREVRFVKSRVFISNLLKIREEADQHYILFNL